jgi:aminoglycoside phosphotransferase (APT) family kinase protein
MIEQKSLFRELHRQVALEFPEIVTGDVMARNYRLIDSLESWWPEIDGMTKTLIHHDFNPRNIAIRSGMRLAAFDWELATLHIPQRDLAELLSFTAGPHLSDADIWALVEAHRKGLEQSAGVTIDGKVWRRGFELALWDFAINRIGMYLMSHTFKHHVFMEHLVRQNARLMDLCLTKR